MNLAPALKAPPFCPNPACRFHRGDMKLWRYVRIGFYARKSAPLRVQRYRCDTCRRRFGDQTFSVTYWLHRPELIGPVFHRLVGCSGFRQIAREFKASPETIARVSGRLGRHCLLFHQLHRPKGRIPEPLALDSFESFEFSQYYPTSYHVAAGQMSHFFYGFTDSECRRRGTMTRSQKAPARGPGRPPGPARPQVDREGGRRPARDRGAFAAGARTAYGSTQELSPRAAARPTPHRGSPHDLLASLADSGESPVPDQPARSPDPSRWCEPQERDHRLLQAPCERG